MKPEIKEAIEFYRKACLAEGKGELDLAEIYYLKSAHGFEQAGGSQVMNAANALNALALLRKTRGDVDGALRTAKRSMQMTEGHSTQTADAEVVRGTAWDLVRQLAGLKISQYQFA